MRIVPIVEGHGDAAAVPLLIGRIGAAYNLPLYSTRPIRTGGWAHLQRAGELERYLELALSHDPDRVVIISDLEDHCPVEEKLKFSDRITVQLGARQTDVEVAFSIREFETWYLHSAQRLSEMFGNGAWDLTQIPRNPDAVRGAKEALSKIMKSRYKETIHQARFVPGLDTAHLVSVSRSFRRLVVASTGLQNDVVELLG